MKYIRKMAQAEFLRFVLMGITNTVITYATYLLFLHFVPYLIAYSICYVVGIVVSYYLNSRFVFNAPLNVKTAVKYPLVYVVQYLFGCVALFLFVDKISIDKAYAAILVAGLSVPINFLMCKIIIKPPKKLVKA